MKIVITGCNGQLGVALKQYYPEAVALSKDDLDIADRAKVEQYDWNNCDVIINAAAYVNADDSETEQGRIRTWKANAQGPANLALVARVHYLHLIHISSEYVFDGSKKNHQELEDFSPLSVYGQTKAAADIVVGTLEKYHILRTTWVVGDGHNFVRTMKNLAEMRIDPKVVDDQFGRLTFTSEIVKAIDHILKKKVKYGVYNVTNSGEIVSWADIAEKVFELSGHDTSRVKRITTADYASQKEHFAPRPTNSDLDLTKLQQTGFKSTDYEGLLASYVEQDMGAA